MCNCNLPKLNIDIVDSGPEMYNMSLHYVYTIIQIGPTQWHSPFFYNIMHMLIKSKSHLVCFLTIHRCSKVKRITLCAHCRKMFPFSVATVSVSGSSFQDGDVAG